jgi:hypothetical protein
MTTTAAAAADHLTGHRCRSGRPARPCSKPLALWRSLAESLSTGSESLRTDDQTATSGREHGELDLVFPFRLWKPFDQSLALSYSYRSISLLAGAPRNLVVSRRR